MGLISLGVTTLQIKQGLYQSTAHGENIFTLLFSARMDASSSFRVMSSLQTNCLMKITLPLKED